MTDLHHFTNSNELKNIIKISKERQLKIIPIYCRYCDYKDLAYSRFQMLPRNKKPLSDWQNKDLFYHEIGKEIVQLIQNDY